MDQPIFLKKIENAGALEDFKTIEAFIKNGETTIKNLQVGAELKSNLLKFFLKMFKKVELTNELSVYIVQNNILCPARFGAILLELFKPHISADEKFLEGIKTGKLFLKNYTLYEIDGKITKRLDSSVVSIFGIVFTTFNLKNDRKFLISLVRELFEDATKEEFDFRLFNEISSIESEDKDYIKSIIDFSLNQSFEDYSFSSQLKISEENILSQKDGFYRMTKQDKKILDLQKKGIVPSIFNKKSLQKLKSELEFIILLDTSGSTDVFSLFKGLDVMTAGAIKYIKSQFNNNINIKVIAYSDDITVKDDIQGFIMPTSSTSTEMALMTTLKDFKDIKTIETMEKLFKSEDNSALLEKMQKDILKYSVMIDDYLKRFIPKTRELKDLSLIEIKEIFEEFVITNGFVKTDSIDYMLDILKPFGKYPYQHQTLKDLLKYNKINLISKLLKYKDVDLRSMDKLRKIFDEIIDSNGVQVRNNMNNRFVIHLTDGQANSLFSAYFYAYLMSFTNVSFGQIVLCPDIFKINPDLIEDMVISLGTDIKANKNDLYSFEQNFIEIANFAKGKNKTLFLTKELHNNILSMFDLNLGLQYFSENQDEVETALKNI